MSNITSYIISFDESENSANPKLWIDLFNLGIKWSQVRSVKNILGFRRIHHIIAGFRLAVKLCKKEKIDVVHCRSYRPAVIGSLLKLFFRCGFIFDMRGFLIDELVADGRWNVKTIKFRVAKQVERFLILSADAITVTSPQFKDNVLSLPYFPNSRIKNVIVIPNCVDICRFPLVNEEHRKILRKKYGWVGRLVALFAGDAFRYRETIDGIIRFFEELKSLNPTAYLVLALYGSPNDISEIKLSSLKAEDFTVSSVSYEEMPNLLVAADIGLSFFKCKNFSNAIASPIKFAEYLSSGLPVVINPGIGDTGRIIEQYKVGKVIDPQNPIQLRKGVANLLDMLKSDLGLRQRCHEAAQKELNLNFAQEQYVQVYRSVVAAADKRRGRLF